MADRERRGRASVHLGYALSSEEHAPSALVESARLAERADFECALVSDHYHPWTRRQLRRVDRAGECRLLSLVGRTASDRSTMPAGPGEPSAGHRAAA